MDESGHGMKVDESGIGVKVVLDEIFTFGMKVVLDELVVYPCKTLVFAVRFSSRQSEVNGNG